MCTSNVALVNSLECYMDDLVDCFEDFVKKSLVVISVALGTIILMIMYVLKVLGERAVNTRPSGFIPEPGVEYQDFRIRTTNKEADAQLEDAKSDTSLTSVESDTETVADSNRHKRSESVKSESVKIGSASVASYVVSSKTASISAQVASRPSFDEKVLREIGLSSCSKPCNTSNRDVADKEEEPIPPKYQQAGETCNSKHHLSQPHPCSKYIAIRTSCCSMCCADDDRR